MIKLRALTLIGLASLLASGTVGTAAADTLQMGNTGNSARFEQPGKPTRGMSRERVQAEFGSPTSRRSPVGDPPITRWEYEEFVVFFEYDRVIHAVSKRG